GSLGTLAVIAEVTVKLYPRPSESRTWLVTLPGLEAAAAVVARVVDSHLLPHALELVTAGAAGAVAPDGARSLQEREVLLAAAFGGITEEVTSQIAAIRAMAAGAGADAGRVLEREAEAAFWDGVRNFAARLGAPVGASGEAGPTGWAVGRASLVLTAVPAMLAALEAARTAHRLESAAATAEAATGSARLALAGPPDRLAAALRDLRETAARGGANAGHLIVEQAPLAVKRAVDPWGPVGPSLRLMHALKQQFDPDRRLNPGRFVGGI
ncbi:MAG TPA: FAD-linked oxidase C-terminal domain-containing protein, partial [Methylomirabilota bacterium]|nr:FAD-linked oxidase C-terminal domain-containing protein [Methylomirabilota bacterium]